MHLCSKEFLKQPEWSLNRALYKSMGCNHKGKEVNLVSRRI